jgi:pimeloyl-ACP methyl ester carboxylesterase
MQNLTVIFSHGRESGPWGTKIRALAPVAEKFGCRVISRDESGNRDPDLRVANLIEQVRLIEGPLVLVGSSMGGYVATVASKVLLPVGLFLMAPAFAMRGYAELNPCPNCRELSIVHGWSDDIVPLEAVVNFARTHQAMLHLVPAGHALVEQIDWLIQIFELFLGKCLQHDPNQKRARFLATI